MNYNIGNTRIIHCYSNYKIYLLFDSSFKNYFAMTGFLYQYLLIDSLFANFSLIKANLALSSYIFCLINYLHSTKL